MLKVLTITSHVNILERDEKFNESEYPVLNKYLAEGYSIKQTIPIIKPADNSYLYSVIFILEK